MPSQREIVLEMLTDAGESGVRGNEFYAACLPRFAARIKELRDRGYEISTERVDANHFVYTLVGSDGSWSAPVISNLDGQDEAVGPGSPARVAACEPHQESDTAGGGSSPSPAGSLKQQESLFELPARPSYMDVEAA